MPLSPFGYPHHAVRTELQSGAGRTRQSTSSPLVGRTPVWAPSSGQWHSNAHALAPISCPLSDVRDNAPVPGLQVVQDGVPERAVHQHTVGAGVTRCGCRGGHSEEHAATPTDCKRVAEWRTGNDRTTSRCVPTLWAPERRRGHGVGFPASKGAPQESPPGLPAPLRPRDFHGPLRTEWEWISDQALLVAQNAHLFGTALETGHP